MKNTKQILKRAKNTLEIEAQAVLRQVKNLDGDFIESVNLINSTVKKSGRVVVCGIGKSGIVGRKICATFASIGVPSVFVHPAELIHGDLGMITRLDLVLLLSYSGESDELKKVLPPLKGTGAKIISMTGKGRSFITKFSDFVLNVSVEKEACPYNLVPTASTTAMLAMGDALALSIGEIRGFKREDYARYHPGGTIGKKLMIRVQQLMHTGRNNPVAKMSSTVNKVLSIMTDTKLGAVSIVDGKGRLAGYFTDGDLRRKLQSDRNIINRKMEEVMTKNPKSITGDKFAVEAAEMMKKYNCDNLPVVDRNNKPVGMIDERDLVSLGIA